MEAPTMLRRVATGALAGALATAPQSGVTWGLRWAGVYRRKAPPIAVAEKPSEAAVQAGMLPPSLKGPAMLAQHIGFGAAGGALFGLLTGTIRPTPIAGALTGLAIWGVSYGGWIPALRIMPPPAKDERGRQVTLIVSHIVYGVSLAGTFRRMMR
jgi:hypothetical protein